MEVENMIKLFFADDKSDVHEQLKAEIKAFHPGF